MGKLVKMLVPATILLIPAYLIRFEIFGIPANALEILVMACFGLAVLKRTNRADRIERTYFLAIILIFSGLLVSTLVNDNWRAGFGIIKSWFAVPLVFGWVLVREIREMREIRNVLKWLYLSVFLVALVSLGYYFSGHLTYDGRLSGLYNSPNFLAMYLAPGVIIGIYLIQSSIRQLADKVQSRSSKLKVFYLISSLIILTGLYLTCSYAAWIAVIISLSIVYLTRNKKVSKRTILIGLIMLLLVIISQWNTEKFGNLEKFTRSSFESRITIWQSAGKILKNNLIFGIGPGNFQDKYLEYQKYFPPYLEWAAPQPHNLYLAFWLQAGIAGFIGFIILVFKWLKDLMKVAKQRKNGADIAAILLGIMFYILLHGLVDTPYWKNDLATVFWIVITLGIMAKNLEADAV